MTPAVNASFNDRPLRAETGQSVAAALVGNGIFSWRSTRNDERPRGLFCGIGVCFDCLVEIDGEANQRACLVRVREGMRVCGALPADAPASDATTAADAEAPSGAADAGGER